MLRQVKQSLRFQLHLQLTWLEKQVIVNWKFLIVVLVDDDGDADLIDDDDDDGGAEDVDFGLNAGLNSDLNSDDFGGGLLKG